MHFLKSTKVNLVILVAVFALVLGLAASTTWALRVEDSEAFGRVVVKSSRSDREVCLFIDTFDVIDDTPYCIGRDDPCSEEP
ncbi:hypothetical protein BGX23_004441, partial [Mortierella sp. AD031]